MPSSRSESTDLRSRLLRAFTTRNYSPRTRDAYMAWVDRFLEFHDRVDLAALDRAHVDAFLSFLANEHDVSPDRRLPDAAARGRAGCG